MASNQRTRGLDKSTRNTLSALDYALEQNDTSKRKADEFTSSEYYRALDCQGRKNIQLRRNVSAEGNGG